MTENEKQTEKKDEKQSEPAKKKEASYKSKMKKLLDERPDHGSIRTEIPPKGGSDLV